MKKASLNRQKETSKCNVLNCRRKFVVSSVLFQVLFFFFSVVCVLVVVSFFTFLIIILLQPNFFFHRLSRIDVRVKWSRLNVSKSREKNQFNFHNFFDGYGREVITIGQEHIYNLIFLGFGEWHPNFRQKSIFFLLKLAKIFNIEKCFIFDKNPRFFRVWNDENLRIKPSKIKLEIRKG